MSASSRWGCYRKAPRGLPAKPGTSLALGGARRASTRRSAPEVGARIPRSWAAPSFVSPHAVHASRRPPAPLFRHLARRRARRARTPGDRLHCVRERGESSCDLLFVELHEAVAKLRERTMHASTGV